MFTSLSALLLLPALALTTPPPALPTTPAPLMASQITFPAPTKPDPIVEATRAYIAGAKPAVLDQTSVVLHPFGHGVPVVTCAPLAICDIELQPGEEIIDVATGDSLRWSVARMSSGPADQATPHVVVKPTDYDIVTNCLVTTTQRTYSLVLHSPSKTAAEASDFRLTRRTAFYYPDDMVRHFERRSAENNMAAERRAAATVATLSADPTAWNFNYRLSAAKHPAAPLLVFDDGTRTYLQFPPNSSRRETPALLALSETGETQIVNYRVAGTWFVVDGVYPRTQLLLGSGRNSTKITIENLRRAQ